MFRRREYAVRLKRAFAWSKEALNPLSTHPVVVYVTQKSHLIERTEDVLRFKRAPRGIVRSKKLLDLIAGQHVPGKSVESMLEIQAGNIRRDLDQVFLGNLGCGLVHRLLQSVFICPLFGPERGQPLADGHQITRPE